MIKTRTTLVRLLKEAGIEPVEIKGAGRSLEVTLKNDKDRRKFGRKVAKWGGFGTGWGGWILRQNYVSQDDGLDFCNPASRHHY